MSTKTKTKPKQAEMDEIASIQVTTKKGKAFTIHKPPGDKCGHDLFALTNYLTNVVFGDDPHEDHEWLEEMASGGTSASPVQYHLE